MCYASYPLNSFFLLRCDLDVVHGPASCLGHAHTAAFLPRLLHRLIKHLDELLLMAADLLWNTRQRISSDLLRDSEDAWYVSE